MAIVRTKGSWYQGIANAIRAKNGTADQYTPAQMAGAIRDLRVYGALASPPAPDYGAPAGTVKTDDAHYGAIAAAIREKNGSQETYLPAQMAGAILAFNLSAPTGSFSIYFGEGRRDFTRLDLVREDWENVIASYTPADLVNGQNLFIKDLPLALYGFRLYEGSTVTEKVFDLGDFSVPNVAFSFS